MPTRDELIKRLQELAPDDERARGILRKLGVGPKPTELRSTQPFMEFGKDVLRGVGGTIGQVVGGVGGGIGGAAATAPALGVGAIPGATLGAIKGGAVGGALTEALIQAGEKLIPGGDEEFNPKRIAAESAVSAIPGARLGTLAKTGSRAVRVLKSLRNAAPIARRGAVIGVGSRVAETGTEEGRLPTLGEASVSGVGGGVGAAALTGAAHLVGRVPTAARRLLDRFGTPEAEARPAFTREAFEAKKASAGLTPTPRVVTPEATPTESLIARSPERRTATEKIVGMDIQEGTERRIGQRRDPRPLTERGELVARLTDEGGDLRQLLTERRGIEGRVAGARVAREAEKGVLEKELATPERVREPTPLAEKLRRAITQGDAGAGRLRQGLLRRENAARRAEEGRLTPKEVKTAGRLIGGGGDTVRLADGREGKVVSTAFGKTKVILPDGTSLRVPRGELTLIDREGGLPAQLRPQEDAPTSPTLQRLEEGFEPTLRPPPAREVEAAKVNPAITPITRLAVAAQKVRGTSDPTVTRLWKLQRELVRGATPEPTAPTVRGIPFDEFKTQRLAELRQSPNERLAQELEDLGDVAPDDPAFLAKKLEFLQNSRAGASRAEKLRIASEIKTVRDQIRGRPSEKGAIESTLAGPLGGAAVGGTIGAAVDTEDRLRGALAGAAVGAGGAFALRKGVELRGKDLSSSFIPSQRERAFAPIQKEIEKLRSFPTLGGRDEGTLRDVQSLFMRHRTTNAQLGEEGAQLNLPGTEVDPRVINVNPRVKDDLRIVASMKGKTLTAEEMKSFGSTSSRILSKLNSPIDIDGAKIPLHEAILNPGVAARDKLDFMTLFEEQKLITALATGDRPQVENARRGIRWIERIRHSGNEITQTKFLEKPFMRSVLAQRGRSVAENGGQLIQPTFVDRSARFQEQFRDYFFANILSGPDTQGRNTIGTAFRVALDIPIAAVASKTAPTQVARGEATARLAAGIAGIQRGFQDAFHALSTGVNRVPFFKGGRLTEEMQFDTSRVEFSNPLLRPLNFIGRTLNASDQFFRSLGFNQDRYGQAFTKASQEGLKPNTPKFAERVSDLIRNDPDLERAAWDNVAEMVYQNDPESMVMRWLMQTASVHPAVGIVIPFLRISGNLLTQAKRTSPFGFFSAGIPGLSPATTRQQAFRQAQAAIGTGVLASIAYLMKTGQLKVNARGPSDPTDRAQWYAEGNTPYTIQMGDGEPMELGLFQPLAIPVTVMAAMVESYEDLVSQNNEEWETEDIVEVGIGMGARLVDTVLQQHTLRALGDLFEGLNNPAQLTRVLERMSASYITPASSLQRWYNTVIDPFQREERDAEEMFNNRLAGQSVKNPPRRSRLGDPIARHGTPLERAAVFLPNTRPEVDPIVETLGETGARVGQTRGEITIGGEKLDLPRDLSNLLQGAQGTILRRELEQLFAQPAFQTYPPPVQKALIERLVGRTRRQVSSGIRRNPNVLQRLLEQRRGLDVEQGVQ